jgi:hypothetical protein
MKIVAAVLALVAVCSGVVSAAEIVDGRMIFPAKNGNVLFPHDDHVKWLLGDCKTCHERPGAIEGFGKAYAHDKCIGCHTPQSDDEKPGPVNCVGCHGNSRG